MAVHPGTADMLGTVADTSAASAGEDMAKKVRKPYTITKSRESWTEQEHDKFLEALQLFDRDWKKIEAFVGSKTVIQIRSHAQKYFLKVQKNGTGEHVPPPRPKRKSAQPYPQKAAKSALAVQQVPTCVSQAEPAYTVVIEPCATTPVSSASAIPAWVHHMAPPGSVGFVKKDIATTGVGPMGGVPPKGQICSNGESSPVIQHQLVPMSQGNGDIVLRGGMESTSHREGAWKEWPPDISQLWQNRLNPENPYLAQELAESDDMHERIFSSAIQLDTHEPQMYSISLEMAIMEKTLCDFDQNSGLLSVDNCVCMLQKCREERDLRHAKHVHAQICSNGLEAHGAIGNYIVPMFVECGSLLNAQQVFNLLPSANEISWTSLILGYVNYGRAHYALNLYQKMQQDSVHPRSYTLVALLKACASLKDLEGGRKMHAEAAVNGFEGDDFVGNSLISLYVKCGSLSQAHRVFNKLPVRDVVSWTSLMDGYAEHGPRQEALKCFEQMQLEGISPSIFTFACSLKACSNLGAIDKGREIHMEATRKGFHQHLHVGNTLVGMYAKCSSPFEAHQVFNKLLVRDVVSWTAVIAGYAEHGPWQEALELYELMQLEGVFPNVVTFACTLKACGSTGSTDKGREIHTEITFKGFESDFSVGNSLVGMYAKCFAFPEAHQVFNKLSVRDAVSWTALIAGYAEHGFGHEALKCFEDMQLEGIPADAFTFACSLKACSCIGALDRGREIHLDILEKGLAKDVPIGNTLIDMYAKCGSLSEAQDVFDKLPLKTVVSWTSLIIGYAEHGPWQEVLRCFEQMQFEGISPNAVTFACVLRACGSIGAIDMGRAIHMEIAPNGLDRNPSVSNGLISMYAKCGLLAEARDVFDKLPVRDVAAWSVMIKGYGVNHEGGMAVKCFEEMLGQGVKPDAVTFTCLLTACSHGSLVRKGQEFFKMMIEDYGIVPVLEHHVCMVGLLARSGHLYEAEMFLGMLCSPSQRTWAALLSACKTYGEKELGMRCFRQLVQINPHVAAWYVLMADIYAGASMWDDAYRLEELRKHTGAIKKPASALIEVNRQVHEFVVGSKQSEEISEMLSTMSLHTKREGHMPNVDSVLKPITDKTKEGVLCEHAEKLAIAFGLLHTPQGETLRVTKSMRMCNDCHDASKIISKIEKREIILRDDCSIHHFKDGSCSCGDMF